MSPLAWDLAHIAAYEDLWLCHRQCGLELLRPELAALYDAFETPRARRGDEREGFLDSHQARAYMDEVRRRSADALWQSDVGDGTIVELVVRHELQHTETMRQTMNVAGLLPRGEPPECAVRGDRAREWIEVPAGAFRMGAEADGFAYDNERPAHTVELPVFAIARSPLTNATWSWFCARGGYERREWWSDAGWSWLQGLPRCGPGNPQEAAARTRTQGALCHISWFEAQALARACDARLPSEAEWEKAARTPGTLDGVGLVWEWTSSEFTGYGGFSAHPYREYSEVFFDRGYRVLRGGSWATHERVASRTFRNWDLPERRQIFAGVRLARDC
jgi:gamma-glutamyl hercynylcysteine S-oxide synthase